MRQRKNVTKFIKRAFMDMGELKQYKRYTKTRLNIISNKQEPFTQNLTLHRLFRRFYLNLKLKQFKLLYKKYKGNEKVIIQQLEKRVDMVLLRSGFVRSLYEARQIINHKNLLVNGKIARVPGYMINVGDIISFKEGRIKQKLLQRLKKGLIYKHKPRKPPFRNFRKSWTNKKYKPFKNNNRKRKLKQKKNKVRATGPNYLEISHSLLLISLIEEPKLTAIKYPFTLQPEKNIKFITLLKKYKRLR
ncbi:hypothetical protein ACTFIW_000497 (mitochondrion) [Dictyostelium discoideum]